MQHVKISTELQAMYGRTLGTSIYGRHITNTANSKEPIEATRWFII